MRKDTLKKIQPFVQFCIIILIAILPFLTVTQYMGIECFLDSFDNPDQYYYSTKLLSYTQTSTPDNKCLVIQRSTHPSFTISEDDVIIYYSQSGITCDTVAMVIDQPVQKIYTNSVLAAQYPSPILDEEVLGKVVAIVDDNLWNSLAFSFWDTSTADLNVRALLSLSCS